MELPLWAIIVRDAGIVIGVLGFIWWVWAISQEIKHAESPSPEPGDPA